ncbi:MAG: DNA cytosine methyltransferase [Anaerovoracaceae bacterium]|jgi:DNA (cytosine-5)-methyltransferase 1
MSKLTLGSLFDGSGGFPLGGLLSGITPLWASEIEPFPIRVTTKRMPFIKHLGDISEVDGREIEPVDIVTFGSPCTDMSVAGKRAGLDGSQSVLFYEAIRIVKEMREKTNGQKPRYIVWENVTGAFSSNKGEDFRAVLEEVASVKDADASISKPSKWEKAGCILGDDYSIAWRTFDAQYWGVPQRRKRIYLVAVFDGGSAGEILFESEGVSGYSHESFKAWQRTAGSLEESACKASGLCLNDQGGNRMDVTEEMTSTLRASSNHPPLVFENHAQDSRYKGPLDKSQTVLATFGTGGNNQPLVMQCFGICSDGSNSMKSANPNSGYYEADTSRTLDCNGGNPGCNQGGMAVVAVQGSMIGRKDENGPQGDGYNEETEYTLNTVDRHAVAYGIDRAAFNQGKNAKYDFAVTEEKEPTIVARGPGAVAEPKLLKIRSGKEGGGKGPLIQDNKSATLSCNNDQTLFEPRYSANKATFFTRAEEELAGTLVATDYKDPPLVNDTEYIVRRLTPTECARLQGFPDWWCAGLETEDVTVADIRFWREVFETHRKIVTKASKPKTDKQIVKWLENPHSDSAEYKMWGNGVALPNVVFVLSGIVHFSKDNG